MKLPLAVLAVLLGYTTVADSATLLPPGKQQFFDANGRPLGGGSVTFSIPSTTTPKQTWKDAAQTILNTNPVALDISGFAVIYGAGCYREIVKDAAGNTIWDQPTCDTTSTSLIWAGQSGGTANSQTLTASGFSSQDGQTVSFIAGATNTGPMTLTINGGSPISVRRDTAGGSFSLSGGEIVAGNAVQVIYEATLGAFHLVNNPATGSSPLSTLSASGTTDLGSAASRLIKVTGSATISSFGNSASLAFPLYQVTFSGSVTLINSATMVLPGGSNLSFVPGDFISALYLGSSTWQVFSSSGSSGAGEIRSFATATCPTGFLEAAGQNVPIVTYPQLSAALGTTWGTSAGNVVLPDSRGRFARGFDHGAGVDSGRAFGTTQGDQLQDHQHTYTPPTSLPILNGTLPLTAAATGSPTNTTDPITGNHGTETRPKNFTVIYCVKY